MYLMSAVLLALPSAWAAPNRAVIVGSNRAGVGQQPLRWAGADAERMRTVLIELGGFLPDEIELLVDPGAALLLDAIDRASADLSTSDGEPARFVFYYSGHARSQTLTLGEEELSIASLNAALSRVPALQRLAILDACQSGEPGAPKGISAEAAFSFVSVEGLSTAGTAVVASSTAEELSQESERLQASMFTHHWISGLRGAADQDDDGVVTLDEAYSYSYHNTVVETSGTAIGAQHPTLKLERAGHGDWMLARPSPIAASLSLSSDLEGAVTIVEQQSGHVVAEVDKQPDDDVDLAVAAGDYEIVIRREGEGSACQITVHTGETIEISASDCPRITVEASVDKLNPPTTAPPTEAAHRPPDFAHQIALTARGGLSYYQPFRFLTGGGEISVHLTRQIAAMIGWQTYATKYILPPEIQLATGVFSEWIYIHPINAGVLYTPMRGQLQPYGGLDAITVAYYKDLDKTERAFGARLRFGLDVMLLEHLGVNADAAMGFWHGSDWDRVLDARPTNLLPQISAGLFLAL